MYALVQVASITSQPGKRVKKSFFVTENCGVKIGVAILLRILHLSIEHFDLVSINNLYVSLIKIRQTTIIEISLLILKETITFTYAAAIFLLCGARAARCAVLNRFKNGIREFERLFPVLNVILHRRLNMCIVHNVSRAI
jgi:hypothetical protein